MTDPAEHDSTAYHFAADAAALHAALGHLVARAAEELGAPALPARLPLTWTPGGTADELVEQLVHGLRTAAGAAAPVAPGRVWCYLCATAQCEHAIPTEPGQVFAGYANNGRPQWQEWFSHLHQLDDERVDLLFAEPPQLLTRIVGRRALIADQTLAYGRNSMTYRILGQLVAGYLPVGPRRCALTVQLVETPDRALHVQLLLDEVLRAALADAPAEGRSLLYRCSDALSKLRRAVEAQRGPWLACRSPAERKEVLGRLFGLLRRLAGSIEQKGRQAQRRTPHAQQRQEEFRRPVHKAIDDLAAATPEDFYRDTVRDSLIVIGKAGRCHVFTTDGRHLTSLLLPGDQLERRKRTLRYLPVPPDQLPALRPTLLLAPTRQPPAPPR
jgi:hypothetical protein